MTIMWKKNMSVGSKVIDDEHKYLFSLVNCVLLAIKVGDPREIETFVEQLIGYTEEHFAHEEKLQIKIGYPGYAENKSQHQQILEKLHNLKLKLIDFNNMTQGKQPIERTYEEQKSEDDSIEIIAESADINEPPVLLIEEISELLRHWILDHVLTIDRKMVHYLSKLPYSQRKL